MRRRGRFGSAARAAFCGVAAAMLVGWVVTAFIAMRYNCADGRSSLWINHSAVLWTRWDLVGAPTEVVKTFPMFTQSGPAGWSVEWARPEREPTRTSWQRLGLWGMHWGSTDQRFPAATSQPARMAAVTMTHAFVPFWIPFAAFGLPAVWMLLAGRRRRRAGHCGECGYDLTGNESGRCPECGESVTPKTG